MITMSLYLSVFQYTPRYKSLKVRKFNIYKFLLVFPNFSSEIVIFVGDDDFEMRDLIVKVKDSTSH